MGGVPFWTVCVSGLLCGAPGGSVFYGRDSVPAGDDLGDADQYLHGPSGAEGSADLCDGSGAADLFLCTGLWMDAFVDLETGKQPEKIFVFCICRFLFSDFRYCDGGVSESTHPAADSQENVRKKIESEPFLVIL